MKLPEWFVGRFRGKEERAEYTLEELEAVLKNDRAQRKSEAYAVAAPFLKDIYSSFDNIRRIVLEIKELECPKDINPRVKTVIRTAKPEFVREVLEALKGGKEGGKEELIEEKAAIDETMEMLAKAVMGPGKYLHMAYPEDIDRIRKELKNLAVKKKGLEKASGGNNVTEDLSKEIKILKERLIHKVQLEKERKDTEKKRETLEKEERSLAQESREIEEGREYIEFLEKKETLQKIKCEKEEKENLVYNLLTPLKRPLKMLRKSLEEKGKVQASLMEMERIADDPVNFLCSSESKDFLRLLTAVKQSIDDNPDIKAEEKARVKQKISAIDGAYLEKIREDISALRKHEAEISAVIERAKIQKEKTANAKELDRTRRDMSHLEIEVARIGKKIEKDAEEIEALKHCLEENASRRINRNVSVRLA